MGVAKHPFGQGELDLHAGEIIEGGDHGRIGDARAGIDAIHAHHAGKRRLDGAIGQAPFRLGDCGLGGGFGGSQLVDGRFRGDVAGTQFGRPIEGEFGLHQRRLGLGQIGALDVVVHLCQDLALFDMIARGKVDAFDETVGLGLDLDRIERMRGAYRLDGGGHRPGRGRRNLDRYGVAPFLLFVAERSGPGHQPAIGDVAAIDHRGEENQDKNLSEQRHQASSK